MRNTMKSLATVVAIAGGLAAANTALADVTVESFDNFTPNMMWGSWGTPAATITSGPTSWQVAAIGYGSLWKYEGDILAAGATQVKLAVDIAAVPTTGNGVIVDLVDVNGAWGTYMFPSAGLTVGSSVLTADLSTTPWLNPADIQHIHMEFDPGDSLEVYDVTFKDLSLVVVPEPATLSLLAIGGLGLALARRRS